VIEKGIRRWAAHAAVYAIVGAATLLAGVNPAFADTFDPSRSSASMLSVEQSSVMLNPGVTVSRTEQIVGTDSIVLPFVIAGGMPAGRVTVTLQDLGWPGLFGSLSFAATTSTSLLAELAEPGRMSFAVSGAGNYFATVYGIADPNFGSGLYSLNLKYSPVPLPAAAWLLLSGLALLPRKTNRHQRSLV
jgi:hypothetical protein